MSEPLDTWLDASGFIDLATDDWPAASDDADLDDPWGSVVIDVPNLTDAQRSFLLGALDDAPSAAELADADDVIIEIPSDPDDVDPFDPFHPDPSHP